MGLHYAKAFTSAMRRERMKNSLRIAPDEDRDTVKGHFVAGGELDGCKTGSADL
jgi:hypothetical protein